MRTGTWAVVLLLAAGCQSPRVVQRAGDEGVVALPENTDGFPYYHQSAARKLIEEHVGPGYEVVEEKEVTTGYATTSTVTREGASPFALRDGSTTETSTVSAPKKEWQIHYRRLMPRPALTAGPVVRTEYVAGSPDAPGAGRPEGPPVPPPVLGPATP